MRCCAYHVPGYLVGFNTGKKPVRFKLAPTKLEFQVTKHVELVSVRRVAQRSGRAVPRGVALCRPVPYRVEKNHVCYARRTPPPGSTRLSDAVPIM